MNLQQARFNMVEQQIRTWEVLDHVVLDLLEQAPRHEYVPPAYRNLAYADIAVPLGDGEVMMPPRVEARLLQSLCIGAGDRALEIGTGSGFLTSLLASLAREVISLEISDTLAEMGARNLSEHGIANVLLERGDGVHGWEKHAPYDVIAVTGSVPILERHFQQQLAVGGRLFVIVGEAPAMEALLIRRSGEDQWFAESLFETVIPKLKGAKEPERFVL
ncbi:MAG TPA: protein-L-isoaspartate O-methyltransferase [Gammaproteobacteria bacterium]|nr:protein-L-isoaspartate O-methyltransferase [Gammaproteobacteria bacterium]